MGREALREGAYQPEVLSVLFQAFDQAWARIELTVPPSAADSARRRLAEILMRLAKTECCEADHLAELVTEAWRVQAPKYLRREFDETSV